MVVESRRGPDTRAIPFRGAQPFGMLPDLVIGGALELAADEQLWVPQGPGVEFRPLLLAVSQGYFVNLLRVRKSGILSRHRHAGPVHAFVLRSVQAGDYAFEPPGETHTLEVPDGVAEMITLFHVSGAYIYVDPDGHAVGVEDVFTKLAAARAHYGAAGLGADYADRFVR
jgi:2,4'-dihydroxyacetophenone dioxygenase